MGSSGPTSAIFGPAMFGYCSEEAWVISTRFPGDRASSTSHESIEERAANGNMGSLSLDVWSDALASETVKKEIAYYYPNPMWDRGDWVKNLILFFDGVALLVPEYMKEKPGIVDPAIVAGLQQHSLLHMLQPETVVDATATEQLAGAMREIIESGRLDTLPAESDFHELSMSRLGYFGNEDLATELFKELKKRGLAKESEDGKSIPMHPKVRSLVLVLLSQILRSYGAKMDAELSPVTDRPIAVAALAEMLSHKVIPTTGSVVAFDMATVSVDVGSIPIDEVLSFREENIASYRRYSLSVRKFAQELSKMSDEERATSFDLRQTELDDLGADLRKKARKAWKKPAALALSLTGAAVSLAAGHPLAAALSIGSSVLGFTPTAKPDMGAYSYLFRAHERYPY